MSQEKETGLVIRPPSEVAGFDEIAAQVRRLEEFYRQLMVEGTDYGIIPGTKKPTIYKSGAELLRLWGGFIPRFIIVSATDWAAEVYIYTVTCQLYVRRIVNGVEQEVYVGEGVGSCSSRESKFRWRWLYENQLPSNIDKESLFQKKLSAKGGGSFTLYRMENENIADVGNTVLKLAKKRAFTDAVVMQTGASRIFDLPKEENYDEEEEEIGEPQQKQRGKPAVKAPKAKPAYTEEQMAVIGEIKGEIQTLGLDMRVEWTERYGAKRPDMAALQLWLKELKEITGGTGDKTPPQEEITTWVDFWQIAKAITGKGEEAIPGMLGLKTIDAWTGTLEEALDELAKLCKVKDWRATCRS